MKSTSQKNERSMTELIAAIRGGDEQAFTELYELTNQEVYRTARAILRDEDAALDVQQDTYVFAYNHLDQLTEPEKLRSWLRTIAVNRARSVLRKQTPVLFTELENEDGEGLPDQADLSPEASPELSLERKETARLVNEILDELSAGQRAAVAMYYYEQMSVPEIAGSLGVSASTVKNQLFRGRKKIEEAVHALEKRGVKLYGLSPMPFLLALMKQQRPAAEAGEAVLTKTLAKTGIVAGTKAAASAAAPVVLHATKPFFATVLGKVVLGVAAAGVVAGGAAGYRWAKSNLYEKTAPILMVDSSEDLQNDPTSPTFPVEVDVTGPTLPIERDATAEDLITEPAVTEPAVTETAVTEPTEFTADPDWPSGTCGTNLRWYLDPDGLLTIEGSGAMEDYDDADNVPWCDYRASITALSLPAGLTRIGGFAFYRCSTMTSVTIPASVTNIGNCSFSACSALTNVKIPDSVTDISDEAFAECTALSTVTIPDGVQVIMDRAFYGTALTDVTIPNSVTSIGEAAFAGCEALTGVTIGRGVMSFGNGVFEECGALSAIHVAADNPSYSSQDGVLFNKSKTELLIYPDGKTDLSYTIPGSVTEISEDTFNNGVLTSVTIVGGTNVGRYTFKRCEALREINAASDNPCYSSQDGVLFNKAKTELIQYPVGKTDAVYVIPNGITHIGTAAFAANYQLTNVTIPNSVTSIGEAAFACCVALSDVTIPTSVTNIEDEAFDTCEALTTVTIPGSVTRIGSFAFGFCTGLTDVTIGDGVTSIGVGAFCECSALTEVTIPASVNDVEENVFEGCSDDLTIYGSVGSVAEQYANENQISFVAR